MARANETPLVFLLLAGALALGLALNNSARSPASRTSPAGRSAIVGHEAISYTPYWDRGAWAIGIGHRVRAGDGVPIGIAGVPLPIDEAITLRLFESDVAAVEAAIARYVMVPLTQGQYDAIADFIFNLGAGAFATSDLLEYLNRGNYEAAAAEFQRWVHATDDQTGAKVVVADLVERRADNLARFLA